MTHPINWTSTDHHASVLPWNRVYQSLLTCHVVGTFKLSSMCRFHFLYPSWWSITLYRESGLMLCAQSFRTLRPLDPSYTYMMAAGESTRAQLWVASSCAAVDNGPLSLRPIPAGACQLSSWLQPSAVHLEGGGRSLLAGFPFPFLWGPRLGGLVKRKMHT